MSEHDEQVAVMNWARHAEGQYPELGLLHAIPNAAKRNPVMASWMVAEGLRAGLPDLHLPVARGGYSSLYVEMKWRKGKISPEQHVWIDRLRQYGNMVCVCWSFEEAKETIENYLEMGL